MELFGTCSDIIYLNVESGSHTKQSGKILAREKRQLIKENVDTDSVFSDAVIVLSELKSQAFNKSTLSYNKNWQRRMENTYGKLFS